MTKNEEFLFTLENSIDFAKRRLYLFEDLDIKNIKNLSYGIHMLSDGSDKEIELILNSEGGNFDEMLTLYDVIRTCPLPVRTTVYGKAQSSCVLIAAAGDRGKRRATKNTLFMLHPSREGDADDGASPYASMNADEVAARVKSHQEQNKRWYGALAERTNKPPSFWKKLCSGPEHFFYAETALEYGLIDEIIDDNGD